MPTTDELESELKQQKEIIDTLSEQVTTLTGALSRAQADIAANHLLDSPAGAVEAFAGPLTTAVVAAFHDKGWLPCDGRSVSAIEWPDLFAAIGQFWGKGDGSAHSFSLPNTAGLFLRGATADTSKADVTGRSPLGTGAATDVGSQQASATRMPNNPFVNGGVGDHVHPHELEMTASRAATGAHQISNTVAQPFVGSVRRNTGGGGNHNHPLTGGDSETRPANLYINYIIKAGHRVTV